MDPEGIILFIVLVFLSAFFSGSETSFSCANKIRIKIKADDGNKTAKLVLKVLNNFDKSIITILIGNNIVNTAASALATVLVVSQLGNTYGPLVATIATTILVFIFGELLPKSISKVNADRFVGFLSYPLYFLMIIFTPISLLYSGLLKLVNKIFKSKEKEDDNNITEDDFTNIIEHIEEEGLLEEDESDIIQSAVDFGEIKVKEIMTPKDDMVALNIDTFNKDNIIKFLMEEKFSRIPVYSKNIDNIIGILHVRSYLKEILLHKNFSISRVLIKPYFVTLEMNIDDVFEELRKGKTHIAIVIDNNKTVGMITMEDILEKLVGDIDESIDEADKTRVIKGGVR